MRKNILNKDFATIFIKEGYNFVEVKPDKKGGKDINIYVFEVDDENAFNKRLDELIVENNKRKEERRKAEDSKYINSSAIDNIQNVAINVNIDELVLEMTNIADAMAKDIIRGINGKLDELILSVKNSGSVNLDKLEIKADELGSVGNAFINAKNKK